MTLISRLTPVADLPELMRVTEVALWCDCASGTIYQAIRAGDLGHVRLGRLVRVPRQALQDWISASERRTA